MKIERLYYTVEQLAAHWNCSIDDVMQLGLTNQLNFLAIADFYYPDSEITQKAQHTAINFDDLATIYYAKEPLETSGFIENSTLPSVLRGDRVTITYHNGIDRLIINTSEIERFESENHETTPPEYLNAKERNNMLKLIYGMARHAYQYDPNASRNDATGGNKNSISATISQYGIDITDDTIRKFLNDAKKLID